MLTEEINLGLRKNELDIKYNGCLKSQNWQLYVYTNLKFIWTDSGKCDHEVEHMEWSKSLCFIFRVLQLD